MVERALAPGASGKARWVAGDDAFGVSPSFREGLSALGMRYVLGRAGKFHGVAGSAGVDQSGASGSRASP